LIVFHVSSGDTHLLASPVGEALLRLQEGPSDLAGLVRALDPDPEGELAQAVTELLAKFEEFGVVEAVRG